MIVVFHDNGTHPLSPLLKKGFKHVFVAFVDNGCWVVVDGAEGLPHIAVVAASDYDLPGYYLGLGHTVMAYEGPREAVRVPYIAASCVGLVKAVMGLRCPALTPWQLYKRLEKMS